MVRPQKNRIVTCNPDVNYFKPRGMPMMDLSEVQITVDEREALRLSDLLCMSHEEAGKKMGVSRATFGRIIQKAHKIVADAIINGKAIKIEGGNYKIANKKTTGRTKKITCCKCNYNWDEPEKSDKPVVCPLCKNENL